MESGVNAWTTWRRQLPGAGFWFSLSVFTGIVIASFLLFETSIQHAITGLVQALVQQPAYQLSLAIVVILLLIFDVLLPVPSMLLALLAATHLGFVSGILTIFTGLCCGSVFGYFLGAGYFRLASRWLSAGDKQHASELANKLGTLALVCLRGVPVLAEVSVLAGGMNCFAVI